MPHITEHIEKIEPSLGFTPVDTSAMKTGDIVPLTSADFASVPAPVLANVPPAPVPSVSGVPITEPAVTTPEPVNDFTKRLEDLQISISGKEAEKSTQAATASEGFRKQLLDVNKQLRAQQLQAMKDEETALGRGETLGFATGEAARVARQNAFETFRLSSLSEALQGNIVFAESQAEKAVNAKYAEKERELKIARQNIMNNYDSFTAAQKKRADAALLAIDKEDAFVKQEKAGAAEAQKATLEYAGIADAKTLDAMSKCKDALCVAGLAQSKGLKTLERQKAEKELATFGESSDIKEFKSFFPNVDVRTPAGQQQFLDWKARVGEAGRVTPKAEERDVKISQFLESKKGTDGFVSAATYQESLRKFIAGGGTQSNFLASFPQQTYLNLQEIEKLPASLRTAQVAPQKTLSAEQQSIINDAKSTWDAAKQTYQATPELRQKIIDRAKELGFDLSPYF